MTTTADLGDTTMIMLAVNMVVSAGSNHDSPKP